MGSLRNPVGPLPSTIYWRRRALLLSLLALAVLFIVWLVTLGGGNKTKDAAGGPEGKHPAPSITPGPASSGPAISQKPGGRDESSDGGTSGGAGGAGDAGGAGGAGGASGTGGSSSAGAGGAAASGGAAGGGGGGSGTAGGGSGVPVGDQVPAQSSLPVCAPGVVQLTLRSVANSYAPGHDPRFDLVVRNSSGTDCKIDLGPRNVVLTITQTDTGKQVWASDDCPGTTGKLFFRVPGTSGITHAISWDRTPSAPNCATPHGIAVTPGTYLVETRTAGFPDRQASFVLSQD